MKRYGLTGYPLDHSRSPGIFSEIFTRDKVRDSEYLLFPLADFSGFRKLLEDDPSLYGLNVTRPWKTAVIPHLDSLDDSARATGAVNTIRISREKGTLQTRGYNTDITGFRLSLTPLLQPSHRQALVLGTGGASKAVTHILSTLAIPFILVSRTPAAPGAISYTELETMDIRQYPLIINTTPLGQSPDTRSPLPAMLEKNLSPAHLLYDLVYEPEVTPFLAQGRRAGAGTVNGMEMLRIQAESAWKIWSGKTLDF